MMRLSLCVTSPDIAMNKEWTAVRFKSSTLAFATENQHGRSGSYPQPAYRA
jgi:uncharacterized protein GlcG (DUF336 family)